MTYEEALSLAQSYGDSLEHHGIRGMKHGRRRFQNEDGTWTEAGLEARRKREGFAERRQAKKEARAAKRAERKAAMAKSYADYKEQKRKNSLKGMTDDELEKKIARLKLENEYKELNRNPLIEAGANLINKYLDYKDKKTQRELETNRQKIELERIKAQQLQAKESTKKAKYDSVTAKAEAKKKKADVKGGLKQERQAQLRNAKTNYRNTTIWGSIGKRANNRAKYVQENRMNAIEAKKAQRTQQLVGLQNQKEIQKTQQEYWKAEQERHKAKGRKNKT